VTVTKAKPKTYKPGSWGAILQLCADLGKDKALERLEDAYRKTCWAAATAWEEPSTYRFARYLDGLSAQQAITLGHLKRMTEEDIRRRLEQG
jgi:hypothetical protein